MSSLQGECRTHTPTPNRVCLVRPIVCRWEGASLFSRPILCSASLTSERGVDTTLVVGSADHSLKAIRFPRPAAISESANAPGLTSPPLTLHTKQYGHSEWVTTCVVLRDGRVVSGGMDGRVCLWDKGRARCAELVGGNFRGTQLGGGRAARYTSTMTLIPAGFSVSKVVTGVTRSGLTGDAGDVQTASWVFSASYDGVVRGWRASGGTGTSPDVELRGIHNRNPVMNFVWSGESPRDQTIDHRAGDPGLDSANRIFTAGKDSKLGVWDVETEKPVVVFTGTKGPVEHLAYSPTTSPTIIATAGRDDDRVILWDMRKKCCASKRSAAGAEQSDGVFFLGLDDSGEGDPALVAITGSGHVTAAPQAIKAPFEKLAVPTGRVTAACISGGKLFAGFFDGRIRVIDVRNRTLTAELVPSCEGYCDEGSSSAVCDRRATAAAVRCISVVQRGKRHNGLPGYEIYSGDDEGELRLWRL